ncbi:carbon-nitrogen hydrolase family protein [Acinetobacter sp. B5B]|uniref:carbon-nitrogen hydrolase family protein n=1 Tax=Acinetobacter baretiae TaxID=2605383 RepID=UPI0018C206EA|nr:carbon-nitrogen hydrolase family protein [Acinetobacter baretiae]MBF7683059.1 carbon-nitrogen hydrolase family protein [Acinetobacter baretiae]MBF7684289.1 carbon-nitrogen hydrolase family protein [Acinetobacter baretiae]
MSQCIKVACVQAAPVFMDLEGTVNKTIQLIEEASQNGAQLIAFPETWIPGYPWFLWLDTPMANMPKTYQYHQNSLELNSESAQRIQEAAKKHHIFVVLGFSERDHGSLYISQWTINDLGETVSIRRKLKATHVERTLFGEGDGHSIRVDETRLGNIGALCCWEHLQPLARYAMYSQHEQIHIAAWPSFSLYQPQMASIGPDVNIAASRLYAAEGQCFVIAPCAIVSQDMQDILCHSEEQKKLLALGGGHARIFGPDGRDLVTPLAEDEEGILYADLDLSHITIAKTAADPVGHYARPDVFQLIFNKNAVKKVITKQDHEQEQIDKLSTETHAEG